MDWFYTKLRAWLGVADLELKMAEAYTDLHSLASFARDAELEHKRFVQQVDERIKQLRSELNLQVGDLRQRNHLNSLAIAAQGAKLAKIDTRKPAVKKATKAAKKKVE
jgi:hypothetical protein